MNYIRFPLFWIILTIIFFLIDLGQFFLISTIIIPLIFCLYCTTIIYKAESKLLYILAFLQCLEYFCFYNFFSLACMYLIPITVLAFLFRKNLYPSIAHVITIALISSLVQIYAIEGFFLSIWPTTTYTLTKITAILIIIITFSLTINVWGMQDNRARM